MVFSIGRPTRAPVRPHSKAYPSVGWIGRLIGSQSLKNDQVWCRPRNRKSSLPSARDRQMFAFGLAVNRTAHRGTGEKRRMNADFCGPSPFLHGPSCRAEIAKNGHNSRVLRKAKAKIICSPDCMAEREGFEPPVPFRARRFSRPVPSTTRPPLRG
jgi:hypothetical protein